VNHVYFKVNVGCKQEGGVCQYFDIEPLLRNSSLAPWSALCTKSNLL